MTQICQFQLLHYNVNGLSIIPKRGPNNINYYSQNIIIFILLNYSIANDHGDLFRIPELFSVDIDKVLDEFEQSVGEAKSHLDASGPDGEIKIIQVSRI